MAGQWQGEVLIETPRLRLRTFLEADLPLFVALTADPETMRYLGGPMTEAAAIHWARDLEARWARGKPGMLPVARREDGAFLGVAGLNRLHWYPDDIEVGWTLLPDHRGRGYATEAGRAWLDHAFATRPGLRRVISLSDVPNVASQSVMRRLGMVRDHEARLQGSDDDGEFDAVVHAITREAWEGRP